MVYIHFPANLTEEELMLQAKYQKLRKKRKAVQDLKAPKPEPDKPIIPKRPAEARDAREVAKKLIKSGAINPISKPTKTAEQSFKRPRGLERKLITDKSISSYQPFSATQLENGNPEAPELRPPRIKNKNVYETFVPPSECEPAASPVKAPEPPLKQPETREKNRPGKTICVRGHLITDEYVNKHLGLYGKIINVSMDAEKERAFVTYDQLESAQQAVTELDGNITGGLQLAVFYARRQFNASDASGSTTKWTNVATGASQKGNHKDKRDLVIYDDLDIF